MNNYSPYRTLKKFSLFIGFVSFVAMVLLILNGCSVKVDWYYPMDGGEWKRPPGT